jgi:hypothetical protein
MATRGRRTLSAIWAMARCEDERLTPPHKLLWLNYRSYEGTAGRGAFVGDDRLAGHLGKSVRSVQMYRADLVEWGYLRQQLRGPNPAMYWAVLPPELDATLPPELQSGAPEPEPTPTPKPTPARFAPPQPGSPYIAGLHGPVEDTPKAPPITEDPESIAWKKGRDGERRDAA